MVAEEVLEGTAPVVQVLREEWVVRIGADTYTSRIKGIHLTMEE